MRRRILAVFLFFSVQDTICLTAFANSSLADLKGFIYVFTDDDIYQGRIVANTSPEGELYLTGLQLHDWGIDESLLFELNGDGIEKNKSISLNQLNKYGILHDYDKIKRKLTLTIPEKYKITEQGTSITQQNVSRWVDGINAGFVNYNINYSHYQGEKHAYEERNHSIYADFTYGLNMDAWRLRYQHYYQKNIDSDAKWYTTAAYLERDIRRWRSQIRLGDSVVSSNIFDGYPFRGLLLRNDDRMLPYAFRTTSPQIRGVAKSNAEVKIWQDGVIIYHTFVAPGQFTLNNVYPSTDNGNLFMVIKESDGTEATRLLPYATMPNLIHEKRFKYEFAVGKYHSQYLDDIPQPKFGHVTLTYGLPYKVAIYSGIITAPIYRSIALGVSRSTKNWGDASFDYRYSRSNQPRINGKKEHGGVFRLRHNKAFLDYGINLATLVQYYPNEDYRNFSETVEQQHIDWWDITDEGEFIGILEPRKKQRLEAKINQYVNLTDSIYLTYAQQAYYQRERKTTSLQLGFNGNYRDIDYDTEVSYFKYGKEQHEGRFSFNITVPLNKFNIASNTRLRYTETVDFHKDRKRNITLSGTALKNYNLGYGVTVGQSKTDGTTLDGNLNYEHNAGELNASFSGGNGYRTMNLSAGGGILIHSNGVTFGPELGETSALVYVPNSPDIGIDNQFGVTTNKNGYAIISNLIPYRLNSITLDEFSLDEGFILPQTENSVIPTEGAIILSEFKSVEREEMDDDDDDEISLASAVDNDTDDEIEEDDQQTHDDNKQNKEISSAAIVNANTYAEYISETENISNEKIAIVKAVDNNVQEPIVVSVPVNVNLLLDDNHDKHVQSTINDTVIVKTDRQTDKIDQLIKESRKKEHEPHVITHIPANEVEKLAVLPSVLARSNVKLNKIDTPLVLLTGSKKSEKRLVTLTRTKNKKAGKITFLIKNSGSNEVVENMFEKEMVNVVINTVLPLLNGKKQS